jgi:serine/threonine protein kinase
VTQHHNIKFSCDDVKMDFLRAQEEAAKRKRDADEMYQSVVRNCQRAGTAVPPYDFLELIGKGAFGRVYKARSQSTGDLVAIKITNIDEEDFRAEYDRMDETIRDFRKEVSILQQLKDSKTKNVNVIHDAFDLHSQLWIVADYCTGGSIRTLMRPFQREKLGLEEKYIIPIARELLVALKGMHDIGIIHRDVKCANVYVTEDGEIQLGDFGIVGVLEDGVSSKRKTIVGTPHWMPKEIVDVMTGVTTEEKPYGTEIDIWSFGCTVYEMAAGHPPYHDVGLGQRLARKLERAPRLEDDAFSKDLKDLVAFCLNPDQQARPSAEAILQHPYIAGTSKRYPTSNLVKLIENFKVWEYGGGSRSSLWMAGPTDLQYTDIDEDDDSEDDAHSSDGWNFSTSESFDEMLGKRLSTMVFPPRSNNEGTNANLNIAELVRRQHAEFSANRGEKSLDRLFKTGDYQLHTPVVSTPTFPTPIEEAPPVQSDLPLRTYTDDAPMRESMIDLDSIDMGAADNLAALTSDSDVYAYNEDLTLKGPSRDRGDDDEDEYSYGQHEDKRATMEWAFPSAPIDATKRDTMGWTFATAGPVTHDRDDTGNSSAPMLASMNGQSSPTFRPMLDRSATAPEGHFRELSITAPQGDFISAPPSDDDRDSMIDLDAALGPGAMDFVAQLERPRTALSIADSATTDETSGNPFDLEDDPLQLEIDRSRFSYHKQWHSEGGNRERRSNNTTHTQMHARGNSLTSNASSHDRMIHTPASSGSIQTSFADRTSLGLDIDAAFRDSAVGGDSWLKFGAFDTTARFNHLNNSPRSNNFEFPPNNGPKTNGATGNSSRLRDLDRDVFSGTNISFPHAVAPHASSMEEESDDLVLEDELGRQMDTLAQGLEAFAKVLALHSHLSDGMDESDHRLSDLDAGFETTREGLEDSEESSTDHSTFPDA